MKTEAQFTAAIKILEENFDSWNAPVAEMQRRTALSPYKVLITTLLSLRTRDERTLVASDRLFHLASTPEQMIKIPPEEIKEAIFSIGFYEKKTQTVLEVSKEILEKFHGQVPENQKDLMSLPGVGLKTANLVLSACFGQPYICVDVHVHRICNRWGFIKTKTPEQTEKELSEKIKNRSLWPKINHLIVGLGQTLCKPISPICQRCPVYSLCDRVNVLKHR